MRKICLLLVCMYVFSGYSQSGSGVGRNSILRSPYMFDKKGASYVGFFGWIENRLAEYPRKFWPTNIDSTRFVVSISNEGELSLVDLDEGADSLMVAELPKILAKTKIWTPANRNGVAVGCEISCKMSREDGKWMITCSPKDEYMKQNSPVNRDAAVGDDKERAPEFSGGGLAEFRNWVIRRIVYPANAYERNIGGRVIVSFVVNEDGLVESVDVFNGGRYVELMEEVLRVMDITTQWRPGTMNGKFVKVRYRLPIDFQLPKTTQRSATFPSARN